MGATLFGLVCPHDDIIPALVVCVTGRLPLSVHTPAISQSPGLKALPIIYSW
jgi:hypothetical protein